MSANLVTIATVALATFALIGIMVGGIAWFYRRGGQERELILAMRENSQTTRNLSSRLDEFMDHYRSEYTALDKRVDNHDIRLVQAEATAQAARQDVSALQSKLWQRSPGATA